MAITVINAEKVKLNEGLPVKLTAPTAVADGFQLDFSAQDERTAFIFVNTGDAAGTVKFLKGDGIQGVADTDTVSIPAGGVAVFRLDSGAYKFVCGANKGKAVAIPSAATIKCGVVVLP